MDEPRFGTEDHTAARASDGDRAAPRLDALWSDIQERTLIEICAPRGFGKSDAARPMAQALARARRAGRVGDARRTG
jgi:hypothetical protein